ncbi:hypothetical protein D3C71_1267490 [compost metagenome]
MDRGTLDDALDGVLGQPVLLQLVRIELQRYFFDVLAGYGYGGYAVQILQRRADVILRNPGQALQILLAVARQTEGDDRQGAEAEPGNLRLLDIVRKRHLIQCFADGRCGVVQIGAVLELNGDVRGVLHGRRVQRLDAVHVAQPLLQRLGDVIHDTFRSRARIDGCDVEIGNADIGQRLLLHGQSAVQAGEHNDKGQQPDCELVPQREINNAFHAVR